ncbi:hypothetical protein FC093_21505 [Ilyomonas limi]|uniref:Uncharacterized protein n=1 Tax=Ilyomonas limi TaxID=2575867 RepID=A0A4U3KR12_9BACT|nr:hypothetical protein [Ilyomonas limi]TKK64835.1 hypothetical protein FC093_21505 [Ilyomonas limi]
METCEFGMFACKFNIYIITMRKSLLSLQTLILLLVVCFSACRKDSDGKMSDELYIATPEKMIDMAAKDWDALKPSLEDKKGYWYTEFPQDQYPYVKAAVSLPAVEETNHDIGYIISMNVDRQSNKATGVDLGTDTITKLSFAAAANLMLEYYNRSLVLCGDTTFTHGQYIDSGGLYGPRKTTVTDIVDRLNNGVVANQYSIEIYGKIKGFTVVIEKYENSDSYWFKFESYDF